MQYPFHILDEIKQIIPVSRIVGAKVKLTKSGHEFKAPCPFHNEKSPSFTVNDDKGFYHCFGCGAHGDIFRFLVDYEKMSFPDAVKTLASQAGVILPAIDYKKEEEQRVSRNLLEEATCFFEQSLTKVNGSDARDYLQKRKLSAQTIAKFRLGYSPDNRQELLNYLKSKGHSLKDLTESGLVIEGDNSTYDRFRGRVMFPIFDANNNIIAFGGRILGDGQPKYMNSPETSVFKKGHVLYGYNFARKAAATTGRIIVVEGYMDAISLHQAGFENVVAPLGTAITEHQIQAIWGKDLHIYICMDGDAAGIKAAMRVIGLVLPVIKPGNLISFIALPEKMDPDDIINKYGKSYFSELVGKALPLSEMIWESEASKVNLSIIDQKLLLEKNLFTLCRDIQDPVVKRNFEYFFRQKLGALQASKSFKPKVLQFNTHTLSLNKQQKDYSIEGMLAAVIQYSQLLDDPDIYDVFAHLELNTADYEKIRTLVLDNYEKNINILSLRGSLPDKLGEIIDLIITKISKDLKPDEAKYSWKFHLNNFYIETLLAEREQIMRDADARSLEKAEKISAEILHFKTLNMELWEKLQPDLV